MTTFADRMRARRGEEVKVLRPMTKITARIARWLTDMGETGLTHDLVDLCGYADELGLKYSGRAEPADRQRWKTRVYLHFGELQVIMQRNDTMKKDHWPILLVKEKTDAALQGTSLKGLKSLLDKMARGA